MTRFALHDLHILFYYHSSLKIKKKFDKIIFLEGFFLLERKKINSHIDINADIN